MKSPTKLLWLIVPAVLVAAARFETETPQTETKSESSAPSSQHSPAESGLPRRDNAPENRNLKGVSGNWAGYAIESAIPRFQNGAVTYVSGSWTVPEVVPGAVRDTYSSVWVGIDGYNSGTVEQIGTASDHYENGPIYYAWFQMYPNPMVLIQNFSVLPGDKMSASVNYIGNDEFTLSILNETTTRSFSTTQRLKNAKRRSAEWIVEAPSDRRILPLANFNTVTFTDCQATLGGVSGPINSPAWASERIDMAIRNYVKATTGPLIPNAFPGGLPASAFTVDWWNN